MARQAESQQVRPVDQAMVEGRPAKQAMRNLWLDIAKECNQTTPDTIPLYLTLSGAEGHDIQRLIDEGILELTETRSVATGHQSKVVAIEHNPLAVLHLQKK